MKFTKVGGRSIPVLDRHGQTDVFFEGGRHGEGIEAGWFAFWTLVGEDDYGEWRIFGRSYSHLPAGNRFRRVDREQRDSKNPEDRRVYRLMARMSKTAWYVRPSTVREVNRWMGSHMDDSCWLEDPIIAEGHEIELRKVGRRIL